jgi:hypothetical protein
MQYNRAAGRELWTTEDHPAPGHGVLVRDSILVVSRDELAQQLPAFRRELCADFAAGPRPSPALDRALTSWVGLLALGAGKIPALPDLADVRIEGTLRRADDLAAWVESWHGEEESGRLLLILTCYQESVGIIADAVSKVLGEDAKVGQIHGGMADGARKATLSDALGGRLRVLVATHGTIGTGIDGLQTVANAVVFAEIPWTPGEAEQSEGRLFRTGQARPVRSVWVTAGIEGRVAAVVGVHAVALAGIMAEAQAGDW